MRRAIATQQASSAGPFRAQLLEQVFSDCFRHSTNTILQSGYSEPLYQPSTSTGRCNTLCYREDFFASALHEVAHWCIAGSARRKQVDFGYWYVPEGRTALQQSAFERVECKPQALEWLFAKACGYRFQISTDNLTVQGCQSTADGDFKQRVIKWAEHWCVQGLPRDGAIFFNALCKQFGTSSELRTLYFPLAELK